MGESSLSVILSIIMILPEIAQIKEAIRRLKRSERTEIYRWIDEEAATDLLLRIGESRNRIEAKCAPKKRKRAGSSR
jgi:hypothetical protein